MKNSNEIGDGVQKIKKVLYSYILDMVVLHCYTFELNFEFAPVSKLKRTM